MSKRKTKVIRPLYVAASFALIAAGCAHTASSVQPYSLREPVQDFTVDVPMLSIDLPLPEIKLKEIEVPMPEPKQDLLAIAEAGILSQTDGRLSRRALRYAMEARACAIESGVADPENQRLTIIDYSLPTTEKRLWIVDLSDGSLIMNDWVAHGSGSGGLVPSVFSNIPESYQSSLGLIKPLFRYQSPKNGESLRLEGLEPGINDKVFQRAIVVHRSNYIGPGKTGRSQGCQAVRNEAIDPLMDNLDGGLMYAFHETESIKLKSKLIGCGAVLTAADFSCQADARGQEEKSTPGLCPSTDAAHFATVFPNAHSAPWTDATNAPVSTQIAMR